MDYELIESWDQIIQEGDQFSEQYGSYGWGRWYDFSTVCNGMKIKRVFGDKLIFRVDYRVRRRVD